MNERFWLGRSVLLTGATGLLGGWMAKRLLELKANPVFLIRDWVPQSELVRTNIMSQGRIVRGDVRDQDMLERLLGEYEVETVFHLAAQTIVTIANRNPISTYESNIAGTWKLLEACRRSPTVKQIVMASSDKAYGIQETLPYSEEAPLQACHPYDVSKACADLIARTYAVTYGTPVAITRCGNLYGGGDLNWSRIVPGTIRSIVNNERPIIRSDGKFIRDYFYVEDAVLAYFCLAEKLALNPSLAGEAFNFSTEIPVDVLEIVHTILEAMGSNLEPEILNEATGEIPNQYLSAHKAQKVLGWESQFSLKEGMDRTIDWYQDFFKQERISGKGLVEKPKP